MEPGKSRFGKGFMHKINIRLERNVTEKRNRILDMYVELFRTVPIVGKTLHISTFSLDQKYWRVGKVQGVSKTHFIVLRLASSVDFDIFKYFLKN